MSFRESLFDDCGKLPKTRYQGSKYKLIDWLREKFSTVEFNTVLDAFSGTSSVSYLLKSMGKQVTSNDILSFNQQVSKALIENQQELISEDDINYVLEKHNNINYLSIIEDNFSGIYYLDEENKWLDIITQNIHSIKNEYKKAMLFWALFQSCLSKRPYNLFHRKNLHIRLSDVERTFGNKTTWDKPFDEHFKKFISEINQAIFDNGKENISLSKDVLELDNKKFDLVYIDPPYIPRKGSLTSYMNFYHFLEGLVKYYEWESLIDRKTINNSLRHKKTAWEDKKEIKDELFKVIEHFSNSKIAISYRSDGIPSIDEIKDYLNKKNKVVSVYEQEHKYALAKSKSKEGLMIGE